MSKLKGIKNVIGFLTTIPVGMSEDGIAEAANHMHLFPLVGVFIGFLAGIFAWFLFHVLPSLVVGMLTLGFLLLITGVNHTDGLLDFGDGVMFRGTSEAKIQVMRDQHTGAGGLTLGLTVLLTTALCIGELTIKTILQALIVSEMLAKFSMVVEAWAGKSAQKGLNTYFVNAMHDPRGNLRLIIALIISFGIAALLLGLTGLVAALASILAALLIVLISSRHFKGITGDVLGASNELTRMFSLIIILVMIQWV
ncbi:adenosylcobinamide-GDP ribazoletransferase [Candidatus Bathyarchaeota archaeon]|nr:adenosylcobinamide-GDP ribazoletransferase [Candidatus Bathyarchaeota archaeon]